MIRNLILKGIPQILTVQDAGGREFHEKHPADSPPGKEENPATQGSTMISACSESTNSNPSSFTGADPVPVPRRIETSLSEGLRTQVLACALLRKSVESEMKELCRTYRSSMPPSRLQLFAWAYPKGSPPRIVYWVRLSRKRRYFDQSLVPMQNPRARWFKMLKIRTRRDLHNAIHWNGLDQHRTIVMSFYDRWWALNKSHSLLAKAMQYAKTALKSHGGPSVARNKALLDLLMSHDLGHLEGPGVELLVLAGQIARLVEGNLGALEEVAQRTIGLPFRLVLSAGPTEFDRVVEWEDELSGRRRRTLYRRSLFKLPLPPQDLAAIWGLVIECRERVRTLSKRLVIFRGAENRLAKAHRESTQMLEQCASVVGIPWNPGQ